MPPDVYPFRTPAIAVRQPLGELFITRIPADILLDVAFSDRLEVNVVNEGVSPYGLTGSQRAQQEPRLKEIGRYINTVEAAFPNAFILAANYLEDGRIEDLASADRWLIQSEGATSRCLSLHIPTNRRMAAIVDGQHRLGGFKYAITERRSMDLVCAVYLDLPNPYQAYLFATINFNQKKVDRSLAYELFGFDLESEEPEAWSPEKLAVFLCRKLNVEDGSPFQGHVVVAAQDDERLLPNATTEWRVSTATIVDGILGLISKNPKNDKMEMYSVEAEAGRRRQMLKDDGSPCRALYLAVNDLALYKVALNYFVAVRDVLWHEVSPSSYIRKTVGIQALFDVTKKILEKRFKEDKDISVAYFSKYLTPAASVDFGDTYFQASGAGRSHIRKTILFANGMITEADCSNEEVEHYKRLLHK